MDVEVDVERERETYLYEAFRQNYYRFANLCISVVVSLSMVRLLVATKKNFKISRRGKGKWEEKKEKPLYQINRRVLKSL